MGLSYSKSDLFFLSLISLIGVCLMSGCTDPGGPEAGTISIQNRLEVYRSSSVPPLDNPQDKIWNDALTGSILLGEDNYPGDFEEPTKCFLKAIIAGGRFYLRAEWRDVTRNVQPNYVLLDEVGWQQGSSILDPRKDQDRMAIMWDMGNNGNEGADCLSMCHVTEHPISGRKMYTTGGGQVDVWQWQAGTTDPVFKGADEYWDSLGQAGDETGDYLYLNNYDSTSSRPKYMHADTTAYVVDTSVVSTTFLKSGEAVPFDENIDWPVGFIIPGHLLNEQPSGSIADIAAFSHYGRNTVRWMVLMSRPLSTGHGDDIDLSQVAPGDSVMVSIAVMDNADRLHAGSKPFYVVFPE